jgi:hypothetical protein
MLKKISWIAGGITVALLGIPVFALETSVGVAGIDARRLHQPPYNLTGRKIGIGAVDIGRPRQFGIDKSVNRHREIPVTRVFYQDKPPRAMLPTNPIRLKPNNTRNKSPR